MLPYTIVIPLSPGRKLRHKQSGAHAKVISSWNEDGRLRVLPEWSDPSSTGADNVSWSIDEFEVIPA